MKKKVMISVVLAAMIISGIGVYALNQGDSKPEKVETNKNEVVTEEFDFEEKEAEEAEALQEDMEDALKNADSEEEQEQIIAEYTEKIENAGGEVSIPKQYSNIKDNSNKITTSKSEVTTSKGTTNKVTESKDKVTTSNKDSNKNTSNTSKPAKEPTNTGNTGSSSNTGSNSNTGSEAPKKEKVWVVDKEAEYIKVPIKEKVPYYWIKSTIDQSLIFETNSPDEFRAKRDELLNAGNANWFWGNSVEYKITGYKTVLNTPEQGHWEYR